VGSIDNQKGILMGRQIIYFDLAKMFGQNVTAEMAVSWGDGWWGMPMRIGSLEVGKVVGVRPDVRDGHVHCGLIIEWDDSLVSVADYQGGQHG